MNKLKVVILASFLSVLGTFAVYNADDVFADCTAGTGNAENYGTGNCTGGESKTKSCPNNSCGSVVYSGATGFDDTNVKQPGVDTIHIPSLDYGSVHIAGGEQDISGIADGAKIYMHALYADAEGDVYIDGVRTHVQKGDLLTYIPVQGIPKGDGTYDRAFAADFLGGWRRRDYGSISEEAVMTIYNSLVTAGKIEAVFSELGGYMFGGIEDLLNSLLEDLTDEEIQEILDELDTLCNGGTCDTTPISADLPSCHEGIYWGDTEGSVEVQNFNTGTGWTGDVWARPGDTVQFKVDYCWGAQAVAGSDYNPARTQYWTGEDSQWFEISASNGDSYLFGENEQFIGSAHHVLITPHNATIGAATADEVPNNRVDATADYAFVLYSPGPKDGSNYNCMIFDFAPHFVSFGYQIPGVATGGCAAISNNGGNMSDAGTEFSQTIKYDRIQAWQLYKHQETGSCAGCNYTQNEWAYNSVIDSRNWTERNSLFRQTTNIRTDPFGSLEAAQSAAGNTWGLVSKHANDTAPHYHDCDSQRCSCNGWSRNVYNGCSRCDYGHDERGYDSSGRFYSYFKCDHTTWYTCAQGTDPTSARNMGGWCSSRPGTSYYKSGQENPTEYLAKDIHPINKGTMESTATVHVPYSYNTSADAFLQAGDILYIGEEVSSTFTVSILPRVVTEVRPGEAYATLLDGEIRAVEFIVDADDSLGGAGGSGTAYTDPCSYFSSRMHVISGCETLWSESGGLNEEGRYMGKTYSGGATRAVPDLEQYPVGSKYCVAVGISSSDSHGMPDVQVVSGMSSPSSWRVSGASCRTIAKKPNFQVWNGGLYTNGSIETSSTEKRVGATLGNEYSPTGLFGSWTEYYVVAAKDVFGLSSGAATGYYGYSGRSLAFQGGLNPGATNCDTTKMTIANESCQTYITGNSNVSNTSQAIILERVYSRYATGGDNTDNAGRKLDNGARYVYKSSDNIKISDIVSALKSTAVANTDPTTYNCVAGQSALKMCRGEADESKQTTSNYASSTLVIHTGGKVTIDTNICYGNGACSSGASVSLGNNNDYFTSIYGLPQVLIIAEKGIDITPNVTQIDSWLITNGNVNTCTGFSVGSGNERQCGNTLMVNGPVFANSMSLNRTAGANPYPSGGYDNRGVLAKNLASSAAITPGEIFNLRPDTLYWAYSQAQRFSQATVTYQRELAPRY